MNEDFLHYVWKFGLFDKTDLKTTSGELICITKPGEHNYNSGPDFFNSRIRLNDTVWVGNVEIHINSSDWNKHLHQNDKAYNNVVLHVVLNHDKEIKNEIGETLPVLELKFRILPNVQRNYELLKSSKKAIACANMLNNVKEHTSSAWLQRMAIERLEEKTEAIKTIFISNNKDWQQTFYQLLARNFGFQINGDAFYLLAKHLPLQLIYKHGNNLFQLESLLFGQSGLLEDQFEEPYAQTLQNEYEFLRKKYSLIPLKKEAWKYLRMRPVNFPTIRIAQFAALLHTSSHLFSKIMECTSIAEKKHLFVARPSEFWHTHYSFTSLSHHSIKAIGGTSISNILINTIAPILFFYGKEKEDDRFTERALDLLFSIEAEDNKITREYSDSGLVPKNAGESQGMINLNKNYCKKFACLNCTIGNSILKYESLTIVDN